MIYKSPALFFGGFRCLVNRLTQVDAQAYSWDNNGNLLSDGQRTFTYDSADRLTAVTQGAATTQFTYNGDGDRLAQIVAGVTTKYALDPTGLAQVLIETTSGQSTHYLPGLAQYGGNAWSYYLPDRLGSVRQLTDPSGAVMLARSYDPFGNGLEQVGGGQSVFGYTGEQTDPTGLVYLRARYYSPSIGRFLTADNVVPNPFRSVGWNRYLYVNNNPLRFIDPSGHAPPTPMPSYCYGPQGPNDTHWKDDPICQQGMPSTPTLTPSPTPMPTPIPPVSSCPERPVDCPNQWLSIVPEGFRLEGGAALGLGLDANFDFVTAKYNPAQSSIIFEISGIVGADFGFGGSGGLLWHNATCLESYKSINQDFGGTIFAPVGGEITTGWSSTTNSRNWYIGAGGGEEFSLAYSRSLFSWDIFNGDVSFFWLDEPIDAY